MKELNELLNIKYNSKIFTVFSNKKHRKEFFELKDNNYYYPDLEDLVNLNIIFNTDSEILYKIDKEDILRGALTTVVVANLVIFGLGAINELNYVLNKEKIVESRVEFYNSKGYADDIIYIDKNKYLEEYGVTKASFSDVRETLNQNEHLTLKQKSYINEFLERLEERLPNVDLSVFNYNLKTLIIEEIDNDIWNYSSDGQYDNINNTISIKKEYHSESETYEVIFHELGHVLNNTMITVTEENKDYPVNTKIVRVIRSFANKNEKFGSFGVEGFNTVLTDYLLTREWENYFNYENNKYDAYNEIAVNCFELMKLMDYTFYDYLDGNVNSFMEELSAYTINNYDVNKIVDLLDTINYIYRETDKKIEVVDLANAFLLKEELIKARLKKEFLLGVNELDILKKTYQVFPYSSYETFKEITSGYKTNINYKRLVVKARNDNTAGADILVDNYDDIEYGNITIYDDNGRIEKNIFIKDVYIYETEDSYKFCYYKDVEGTKYLHDFETNELMDDNMFMFSVEAFLHSNLDIPTIDSNTCSRLIHEFDINTNIINNPYVFSDLEYSFKGKPKMIR